MAACQPQASPDLAFEALRLALCVYLLLSLSYAFRPYSKHSQNVATCVSL